MQRSRNGRREMTFVMSDEVAAIRAELNHPVIDGDGHVIEAMPAVFDIARDLAGSDVVHRMQRFNRARFGDNEGFAGAKTFHGLPAENTLDRMTVMLPNLLRARLDEFGIDFGLLYPSFGLVAMGFPDDDLRQVAARALNIYYAQTFVDVRDRLEPVAVIP